MRVGMNFALIDEALFVIVKKLYGVLDGDHVLFAFAVDLVQHGGERSGLARTGRAGDEHEPAGLVAKPLDDQRQAQCIKTFDFPGNGTEDRADRPALIETIAAEARQVFQAERKVQLQIFFEAMLLGIRKHAVREGFRVRCRERRHVQRAKLSVNAHAGRAVRGDVEVAASHLDHLLQQFTQRNSSHRSPSILEYRLEQDFFHRGLAQGHLDQAAAAESNHPLLDRLLLELQRRRADEDEFTELVIDLHDLVETGAALVAALVASRATLAVINLRGFYFFRRVSRVNERLLRDVQLLFAIRTNTAYQALRANQVQRGGHEEGLDAHVHQPADGGRSVVGVEGGQHQVAGERSLDRDLRRFKVANLTDQDDVGILAKESAERGGEVQADLLLHLNLVDTRQLEFDGVFGGHDIRIHGIERRNRGIESVRFARSCWAGDQHHAVGLQNIALKFLERLGFKSELGHVQPEVFLIQQAHDDLFAVQGRDGRNAEVEFLFLAFSLVLDHDAAVLRQALFRDVQFGHDLQAAGDGILQAQGRGHHGGELSVNAEAHAHFEFVRLNVNIARATLHGIRQDQVDQLDDRSLFRGLFKRGEVHLRFFGGQFQLVVFINEVLHQIAEFFVVRCRTAVEPRDGVADGRFGGHYGLDVEARHELDVVHRKYVGGIRHGDGEHGADA